MSDFYPPSSTTASPARPRPVVLERLAVAVARVFHRGLSGATRVEVPVGPVHPLAWLHAQDAQTSATRNTALYWHGRGEPLTVAAYGVAEELTGTVADVLPRLEARVEALRLTAPVSRYYGGLRFDGSDDVAREERWAAFEAARFVLPRFELTAGPRAATLACHVLPGDDLDAVLADLDAVRMPVQVRLPLRAQQADFLPPRLRSRADVPNAEGWASRIAAALDGFDDERFEKVVLARRAALSFSAPMEPLSLLDRLEAATPGCYHFAFRFADDPDATFLGASPERLICRDGRRVETEAVAGTRPRGLLRGDDARLRDELLGSEKDRREHGYVRDAILDALRPVTTRLDIDAEASELALASKRHLRSGIRGTLRDSIASTDLLVALHPTPAVGGTPTDAALAFLRATEPFDRGWYAGPVGWVGVDSAEFAVAIRSGLVRANTLALYSGAGIVRGSEAEAEWAEIEHKLSDFLGVLGLSAGAGDGASGDGRASDGVPHLSLG